MHEAAPHRFLLVGHVPLVAPVEERRLADPLLPAAQLRRSSVPISIFARTHAFVEWADQIKDRSTIQARSDEGGIELGGSSLFSVCADIAHRDRLTARKVTLLRKDRRGQQLNMVTRPQVVGVEEADDLALGAGDAEVARSGLPTILLVNHRNRRAERCKTFRRCVGRAVVDHDDLNVWVGLVKDRLDRRTHERLAVEDGNDDRDEGSTAERGALHGCESTPHNPRATP